MSKFENYYNHVNEEAEGFVEQYLEDFIHDISNGSTDVDSLLEDDGKLHEYCDQNIVLRDAVEILEQSNNVEEDSGLWESLSPIEAVESMGFWTFKNDMRDAVREQLGDKLEEKKSELESELEDLEKTKLEIEEKMEELEEERDELDDLDEMDENEQKRYDEIETKIGELEKERLDDEEEDIEDVIEAMGYVIDYLGEAIDSL